jgi:fibro-slime domain-containing protein/uncharacterized repeat protein (TIGR01451 family)
MNRWKFSKSIILLFISVASVIGFSGLVLPTPVSAETSSLTGTIRDFLDSHPDFENGISGLVTGIVQSTLGGDDKPVYSDCNCGATHGQTAFNQWYRDVTDVNLSQSLTIVLDNTITPDPNVYTFADSTFFPIDGQLFGNQGRTHNYHFTYELHTQFTYQGGEFFQFTGDDDLWVFINNQLVIDLGGVHGPVSGSVDLDTLGLSVGETYNFDLFFAERHTVQSNFRIDTSIILLSTVIIDIRKQAEGPDTRTFPSGSDVPFEIVVTNTGQADLSNVEVTDVDAPGCDNSIGDLAAGDSVSYNCTAPNVTTSFENIACVEGEALGIMVEDCDPSTVEIIDIDIRKQEEGPDTRIFPPGSEVLFEIVVTNTGDEDLENVIVTDILEPDCDRIIGFLASGESLTYTCTTPDVMMSFVNEACVTGERNDITVEDCDPSTVEIEGGGEGCTPGYWKQSQHFDSWTAPLTPDTLFSDVFEDAFPGKTLLAVLKQGGGGLKALGRHTVAALLNAASPGVSYDLSVNDVIEGFNDVFPGGDYEGLKDLFEGFNEQGCPLN